MAYEWQSDIIRPDGENGTEVLDTNGVYQPQIEGGDNITIEDGKISASGTLENVQADYTETDSSAPSYIKHKPDLSIYATASGMETELAGKQDVIEDLSTIRSGAEAGSTAVQPGDLATVATTGSYTSLSNTPQNIVQDANYVHTDNNFTNADKGKLDGIAAGAEVNVQADWSEADPSSDAYIANKPTIPAAQQNADWNASSGVTAILNKPDLSSYATDSELTDGLATKQDIISDLDSIRSGAALGATAAQPSDLPSSDELLPSATSGDAGKILSVDANGDPEWITPSGGTTYSAGDGVSIDANNVISADVDGTTIGIDSTTKKIKLLSTIPSVDQTYNASSTNAQSGTAVAGALAGVNQVPASTSADEDKVLTVNSSGNPVWAASSIPASKPLVAGSNITITDSATDVTISASATAYTAGDGIDITNGSISADVDGTTIGIDSTTKKIKLLSSIPAVDQTYNASSTNAQSGAAVAQAIAAIPSSSYTAGDGIDITSNEISVIHDSTLTTVHPSESVTATSIAAIGTGYAGNAPCMNVPSDVQDWLTNGTGTITIHVPGNSFKKEHSAANGRYAKILFGHFKNANSTWWCTPNPSTVLTTTYDSALDVDIVDEQDVVINVPYTSWSAPPSSVPYITVEWLDDSRDYAPSNSSYSYFVDNSTGAPFVFSRQDASVSQLSVAKPVPASTASDENKVLTVNSSGNAVWATAQVVTVDQTYNASSTNAQSGTAVAGALATVNQVPASTSADQDKVLTVNSSGTPVWAAAQGGGGGSGGDSEFPYDPGYMHTDWNKMVVRFSDTTYDPTTKASAAYFQSITPLNEPGVYEYDLTNPTGNDVSRIFANEWNDYSNNIVDVLQFTPNDSYFKYGELFYNCSGLRSVWNWRGQMKRISDYFYGCPNLEIVDSKAYDRWVSLSSTGYLSSSVTNFGIQVKDAQTLFKDCPKLKQAKILIYVWDYSSGSAYNACYGLKKLEVGPLITGQCSLESCYGNCVNMTRIYGRSDFPALDYVLDNSSWSYPDYVFSMNYAFQNCISLTDLNGWRTGGAFNNMNYAFAESGITEPPFIRLAQTGTVETSNAFYNCKGLKRVPLLDYAKITNANNMFARCESITDVSPLTPLATACTNVNNLIGGCINVITGALDLYTALSGSQTITSHGDTFSGVGREAWNDVRSQIPSSWGGTGA